MTDPARPPHLPPLANDYIYDHGKVRGFYDGDFRDPAAFERQAERVRSRRIAREDLAAVLTEQNKSYGCGPETLGAIERIVRDKACAVVTGQQVGLFSGPLYTIYKALTATKLADALGHRGIGSFVPVFWLASDDHDLAEIDHIALMDKDNQLREIRCPAPSRESKVPVSNIALPPDVADCLEQLKGMTLDTEFKAAILGSLSEAYAPGRSYVEAFGRWMTRLFRSRGLILIDAGHPHLKEMGRDVFYREIAEDSPSTRQALAASERLRQAGYEAQIPLHAGILNQFYVEGERRALRWKDGAFDIKGLPTLAAKEDLLRLAGEKPFLFSPNVLLRPLYQDAVLPTVAYVGGPSEIGYFAQLKGVYEAFGLPMPVIYPRKSLTIVERKVDHILKKYRLSVPDLWRNAAGAIADITKEDVPDSVARTLLRVRDQLERDYASLKSEIAAFDPGLAESVDLAKGKMNQQLNFLEKKARQAATKRNDIAVRQLHKAVDNLFPNQHFQERVFNIVPYLIKYGPALMDQLDQAIDIDIVDHQFLAL
ncbi:MAG TPA: bacillithiol biosynthesis cysteine-adding enzyme BshC [Terriglobales bacterium]|nr:bacillithiol biosynthesis cysteine-adding enzyme BshC [Terriglobales bacterium]